jgi:outer membrane protein TolC
MRIRILVGLALGAFLSASAQTTTAPANMRALSMRECFDLALRRNLDLQIEYLTADIARYNLSGAYGAYVPTFSFNARHDFVSQPADYDPHKFNPDFPYELNADTLGPALNGQLPMGLSYDLGAFAREDNAVTDFRGDPSDARFYPDGIRRTNNYYADAGLTLRQHLLKDFWIDPDRQTLLVRRKDLKISQQAVRFQVMKTVLAVELGYYDLVAAREQVRVQEKALELRQQLVSETRRDRKSVV